MNYTETLKLIGHTPMIHLSSLDPKPGVKIYAKLEFMNPTGSIKDRIIAYIIQKALAENRINEDTTIVEGSSGNTAASVAMVASRLGLKAILCVPDKASDEKISTIKAYGADVRVMPAAVAPDSDEEYGNAARNIASDTPNCFYIDQYNNPLNPEAHYATTGMEIWEALNGRIDCFVATGSTGGTVSGVGKYLKERNADVRVTLADPQGSIYKPYFDNKADYESYRQPFLVEGAGKNKLVGAMDFGVLDDVMTFTDEDAFGTAWNMARDEGLMVGGSSGGNVWTAHQIAQTLEAPANVVTILPDTGFKYLSTFFNPSWLEQKGLAHIMPKQNAA